VILQYVGTSSLLFLTFIPSHDNRLKMCLLFMENFDNEIDNGRWDNGRWDNGHWDNGHWELSL